MNREDLTSLSALAGECGVTLQAIRHRVQNSNIEKHRLYECRVGGGLVHKDAERIRRYYKAKRAVLAVLA